jgi:hypothetical protein
METEVQNLMAHARGYEGQHFFNNRSTGDQLAAFRVYLVHPCSGALYSQMLNDYTDVFNSLAQNYDPKASM